MADELKTEDILESYTEFSIHQPQGVNNNAFTNFWRKFTATIFRRQDQNPFVSLNAKEVHPLRGDVATTDDPTYPAAGDLHRHGISLPIIEQNRRRRYRDYEDMDSYPELAVALDMYADDATLKDKDGHILHVKSSYPALKDEIEKFFKKIRLDRSIWDIVRNTAKYGDNFLENIAYPDKPKLGIRRIKILNPNFIFRKEDEYGILRHFEQQIPDRSTYYMSNLSKRTSLPLDKNQIVHFRIRTADSNFIPYGKSIMAAGARLFKQLRLMEDAMFIYRITRAPERRIFYLDIANLPPHKAEVFIEKMKQKFQKEKYFDTNRQEINERFNPMGANEDIFLPLRPGSQTKIDTLKGAENLGEVDDVKYFRDKILTLMKIPPDYLSHSTENGGASNQGTLREKDVKYGRAVKRLQEQVMYGLETLVKRHLTLRGFPNIYLNAFTLYFNDPCAAEENQRLDMHEKKARVLQAYIGLDMVPKDWLFKEFFGLEDHEIVEMNKMMDKQREEEMEREIEMQQAMAPPPGEQPQPGEEQGSDTTINGDVADNGEEPVSDTGAEEEKD